jgi:hypothetical protein
VNPEQAVMCRCRRKYGGCIAQATIDRFKPSEKTRDGTWAYGNVVADAHMTLTKLTWYQCDFLAKPAKVVDARHL